MINRNDILAVEVTFVPPRQYAKKGYPLEYKPLEEVLVGRLQRHPKYCELIAQCRELAARGDDAGSKAVKKSLPTWLLGRWYGTAQKGQLVKSEPYMFFDIDSQDNGGLSVDDMKAAVSSLPFVAVAAVSARGQGIYGIVPVPDDAADEKRLQGYFRALQSYFKGLGLVMDGSCKNANRGRYLSLDLEPYIADECEVWSEWQDEPKPAPRPTSTPTPIRAREVNADAEAQFRQIVRMLEKCEASGIDPFERKKDWLDMGRALAWLYGERGRAIFVRWSAIWARNHGKQGWDPNDAFTWLATTSTKRFDSPGIIFKRCKECGVYHSRGRVARNI